MQKVNQNKTHVLSPEFCNKVRTKLEVTEKQLPDRVIRKIFTLNSKLITKWVIDNPDGFMMEGNGILAISRKRPTFLDYSKELRDLTAENRELYPDSNRIRDLFETNRDKYPEMTRMFMIKTAEDDFCLTKMFWFNKYGMSDDRLRDYIFKPAYSASMALSRVKDKSIYLELKAKDFADLPNRKVLKGERRAIKKEAEEIRERVKEEKKLRKKGKV